MPKKFVFRAELPHGVRQVHAALTDERYWRWRLEPTDAATLAFDEPSGPGPFRVTVIAQTDRGYLPDVVRHVLRGPLVMSRTDEWNRLEGNTARGTISGGAATPRIWLEGRSTLGVSDSGGTTLKVEGQIAADIPIVGGRIELLVKQVVMRGLAADRQVLAQWLQKGSTGDTGCDR